MRVAFALALLACVCAASALNLNERHVQYSRAGIPADFTRVGPAALDKVIEFYVALPTNNMEKLYAMLEVISDPTHVQYGQYLSKDELRAIVAPPQEVVDRVLAFLQTADNVVCEQRTGDALRCKAPVASVNALFQTEMHEFVHEATGVRMVRHWGDLSFPAELRGDIEFVSGLGYMLPPQTRRAPRPIASTGADYMVLPETLRRLYNVSDAFVGSSTIQQCVAEFPGNFYELDSDLATFATAVGQPGLKVSVHAGLPSDPTEQPSIETTLDIQYIAAMGKGNTNWIWNTGAWMFEFAVEIQAAKSVPSVISMSYAWSEYDQCGDTTGANCTGLGVNATGYVQRTNAEFAKVGLMGITMLGASGDSGCHGRTDSDCFLNPYMFPPYPASSPFITTVGGTQLVNGVNTGAKSPICQPGQPLAGNCATGGQEIVSSTETGSAIVSGGGFALYSPMPNWQAKFVLAYLNNQTVVNFANSSYFNMQGRGFPDVSALAHNFFIESGGAAGTVDGTSAATPSFAGLVALINAHRNAKGRPAVGFMNPLLYAAFANTNGAAYNDITVGSNRCTEDGCSCLNGFLATPGWDAATGLGTPNFGVLINAIDAMDEAREALIARMKQQ